MAYRASLPKPRNIGLQERAVSVLAGLLLAAAAVKPRPNPLLNLVALVGGSYLAYRGATGYCPVKAALDDAADRDLIDDEMDHIGAV